MEDFDAGDLGGVVRRDLGIGIGSFAVSDLNVWDILGWWCCGLLVWK